MRYINVLLTYFLSKSCTVICDNFETVGLQHRMSSLINNAMISFASNAAP